MTVEAVIKPNTYFDSVSLMLLSTKANQIEGVKQAVIAMGTPMNKGVLGNVGLLTPEIEAAGNGDLVIVVEAESSACCARAFAEIDTLFARGAVAHDSAEKRYPTLDSALRQSQSSNLAIISVPGEYAAREARKALDGGLNVLIFSDNVSIAEEAELKKIGRQKRLLVMGPDCGTAILGHVGLCFANAVRPGNIGIIGASGTGSQEVSVRIHDFGGGITQLIGTGGRDLSEEVGGITMIDSLRALKDDPATAVILLISKPPAKSVEKKVLAEIESCDKPVVVCFLGGSEDAVVKAGGHFAGSTKEAALKAVVLAGKNEDEIDKHALNLPLIEEIRAKLSPDQKYIRALLCGGTLCHEMMLSAQETLSQVYSNVAKDPDHRLRDINLSRDHTFLDLGDDEFTRGRPHPMIDPGPRNERILQEAEDPAVGVIVLDFVLGFGAHEDPVGLTLPAIVQAKEKAAKAGRHLEFLGYVLGSDLDSQSLSNQIAMLEEAGVTIASSCTNAGLLARGFVEKEKTA